MKTRTSFRATAFATIRIITVFSGSATEITRSKSSRASRTSSLSLPWLERLVLAPPDFQRLEIIVDARQVFGRKSAAENERRQDENERTHVEKECKIRSLKE